MLINDNPVMSYSYYLPPTFIRMMGAYLSEELEPLPEVKPTMVKRDEADMYEKLVIHNILCEHGSIDHKLISID